MAKSPALAHATVKAAPRCAKAKATPPPTRGAHPPFFLGAAPDLRGATNFYEAVMQTLSKPPLPTWLDEKLPYLDTEGAVFVRDAAHVRRSAGI